MEKKTAKSAFERLQYILYFAIAAASAISVLWHILPIFEGMELLGAVFSILIAGSFTVFAEVLKNTYLNGEFAAAENI